MKKKYDVITIGGATEDITVYTEEGVLIDNKEDILKQKLIAFEFGAKLKVEHAFSNFGGGAANAAICLSRLGFKVAAVVAIGDDYRGERVVKNFKDHKVDAKLVQMVKECDTGLSFLLVGPSNEHVVFSNRAANSQLRITPATRAQLKNSKWIYMTSLSGKWPEIISRVFGVPGVKIAWNPGHIQLHSGIGSIGRYLKKCEMVIVNKDEAIELVVSDLEYRGKSHGYLNNIRNLLEIFKNWGPKLVVITSGKNGADAYDGENFYHQGVIREKRRVDTTGVGDAFGSSLIAGLMLFNGDIAKAMYLSAKNTASVIAEPGAQNGLLAKKDIIGLFKN